MNIEKYIEEFRGTVWYSRLREFDKATDDEEEKAHPTEMFVDWLRTTLTAVAEEARLEAIEEAIKLSDKIEMSVPDGGTKEWMAFKHFRNTLRDSLAK